MNHIPCSTEGCPNPATEFLEWNHDDGEMVCEACYDRWLDRIIEGTPDQGHTEGDAHDGNHHP